CEVATAAALIAKDLAFRRGAAGKEPDFVLTERSGLGIECTSAHVKERRDRSLTYKLAAAVRAKLRKVYHGPCTILFLDYTNLLFNSADVAEVASEDAHLQAVAALEETRFGALVMLAYMLDEEAMGYNRAYHRIDRASPPALVRTFLDD